MSQSSQCVIYTHGGGRLGNQMLRWAHWQAWALDHADRVKVINLAFWPYAELFDGSAQNRGCVIGGRSLLADRASLLRSALPDWALRRWDRRMPPLVFGLGRFCPGAERVSVGAPDVPRLDLDGDDFLRSLDGRRFTTIGGWHIQAWERVSRRKDELRAYFQPVAARAEHVRAFVSRVRANCDLLFGVLIRGTDYRAWRQGRYFFSTADYVAWMRQMEALHAGHRVGFLVTSDEFQDPEAFTGLTITFASGSINVGGDAFDSFVELSLCDGIMSPPSTFATMAAFVGDKPIWPLIESGRVLCRDQVIEDALIGAARHPVFSETVN